VSRLPYASPGDPRMAPLPELWLTPPWMPDGGRINPAAAAGCPHRVVPGCAEALACTRCGKPLPTEERPTTYEA
jgi:hypothetical protein